MEIDKEIKKLIDSRLLETEEDVINFENSIEKIINLNDPTLIEELCKGFDDNTEDHEVMFGLIHAIEKFEPKIYLNELIKGLPNMIPDAKFWAKGLLKRILNHEDYRRMLPGVITEQRKDIFDLVVNLLNEINNDNPKKFSESCNYVLSELK